MVNGTIVVKDSKVLRVNPGQEIRFPVEEDGRLKPISVDIWKAEHTIGLDPELSQIHLDDDSGAGEALEAVKQTAK